MKNIFCQPSGWTEIAWYKIQKALEGQKKKELKEKQQQKRQH